MILCFAFRSTLVRVIQAPLSEVGSQIGTLKALGITDSIVISFHLAFYAGIVLSFPLLLYFLAEFVLPALTAVRNGFISSDRRQLRALSAWRAGLLFLVAAENDSLFLSRHRIARLGADVDGAAILFFRDAIHLGFGLAFELPVVVLALVRFGLITYRFMARTRPYAIVLIFILATIITPTPDILTLIAMALPMCLLYESCIWIAWFMQRRARNESPVNRVDHSVQIFSLACSPSCSARRSVRSSTSAFTAGRSIFRSIGRAARFVRPANNRFRGIRICR